MLFEYMTFPDGLHTAYSERRADGSISFVMEWPSDSGISSASCRIPEMSWTRTPEVTDDVLASCKAFVEGDLDLIVEMADEAPSRFPEVFERMGARDAKLV